MEVWSGSQLTTQGVAFGGLDAWVYSKPFGGAKQGGDIYYASSCATGRITRLLLADVSGHGREPMVGVVELEAVVVQPVDRLGARHARVRRRQRDAECQPLVRPPWIRLETAHSLANAV